MMVHHIIDTNIANPYPKAQRHNTHARIKKQKSQDRNKIGKYKSGNHIKSKKRHSQNYKIQNQEESCRKQHILLFE